MLASAKPRGGEREGVVAADLRHLCREPRRLGDVPCRVGRPTVGLAHHVAGQGQAVGRGVVGIELDGPIGELHRFVGGVAAPFLEARQRAHAGQVRVKAFGRPGPRAGDLGLPQLRDERPHDAVRHAILQLEQVVDPALEALGPQMRGSLRIDQLARDADPAAGPAHAAFEDVARPEVAADLLHVDRPALVGEGRVARDDEQVAVVRQGRDDLVDHPVGEIVLLRIGAQVLER